jgi:hypothetical protein
MASKPRQSYLPDLPGPENGKGVDGVRVYKEPYAEVRKGRNNRGEGWFIYVNVSPTRFVTFGPYARQDKAFEIAFTEASFARGRGHLLSGFRERGGDWSWII